MHSLWQKTNGGRNQKEGSYSAMNGAEHCPYCGKELTDLLVTDGPLPGGLPNTSEKNRFPPGVLGTCEMHGRVWQR